jgi:hypothetical protein
LLGRRCNVDDVAFNEVTKVQFRHMRLRRGARTVILLHVVNGSGVPSMFEILLVIRVRAKSEARCLVSLAG